MESYESWPIYITIRDTTLMEYESWPIHISIWVTPYESRTISRMVSDGGMNESWLIGIRRDHSYEFISVTAHPYHHQRPFTWIYMSHEPFLSHSETILMDPYEKRPTHIAIRERILMDPYESRTIPISLRDHSYGSIWQTTHSYRH